MVLWILFFAPEDVELICLRHIDVEDLLLSEFNRKSTSPHLDMFSDVNFMCFQLLWEYQALIICPHLTINVPHHFFIFQNPLCYHVCSIYFLNSPWLKFIFRETELLCQSALLCKGVLLLLQYAKNLFITFQGHLLDLKGLCYCTVKLYSWPHGKTSYCKVTVCARWMRKKGPTPMDMPSKYGITMSFLLKDLCGHYVFRNKMPEQWCHHLHYTLAN